MKPLTDRQQKIYDFLKERSQYGVPPSVREICAATGLKSTSTVHAHLKALEHLGYISRDAGLNRAIRVEGAAELTPQVPILGKVTAGLPILAVEEIQGYLPVSADLQRDRELFALTVRGESMINAGILDGDYVVVERVSTANNGEIVVALLEDEATVKRFFREKGCVRLQPENDDFEPIYTKEASILGKVVSVVRYYD